LPLPWQAVAKSLKKYERLLSTTLEQIDGILSVLSTFSLGRSATPDTTSNRDAQDFFRDYDNVVSLDCNALWDPQLLLPAISYAAFKHAGSLL
jgi:hypothetical protein